jgi:hypothetical protein
MTFGALFNGHVGPDPKDVNRSMHACAVQQRHRNACEAIVLRVAVKTTDKAWSTRSITSGPGLSEDLVDLLPIVSQSIL